jgi:ferredoxin
MDAPTRVVAPNALNTLVSHLRSQGYRVVGPRKRDGAIVYDDVESIDDLPRGWTDEQDAGHYRLARRDDDALFGYTVGPHSWKRDLFPPRQRLWTAVGEGDAVFRVIEEPEPSQPMAFLGVRACELAAIAVQDRVFLQGVARDRVYGARRDNVVLIAVNCGQAGGTCFCASMGTGPRVGEGADLVLTEVLDGGHQLVVEAGTPRGAALATILKGREADDEDLAAVDQVVATATAQMGRELDTTDIRDLLMGNLEHPRWQDVAERCLACTNCTMVCPTCFCNQTEDTTDLSGTVAHHDRRWDSCFTLEFTHFGPGSVRSSISGRYRQWMTHKLASWHDQFDQSGCVGCGRCITWCPVGIDITQETAAIRETDGRKVGA